MRSPMRRVQLFVVCFVVLPAIAIAGEPAREVAAQLEKFRLLLSDQALLADGHEREREARIRDAVMAFLDIPEITRRVIQNHRANLSTAQQKEFADLFAVLLGRMADPLPPRGEEWAKAEIDREVVDGEFSEVEAHFIMRVQRDVPVTYRLRLTDGKWKLYDWGRMGTSFVANYKAQINKVVGKSSFDGLIKVMREQKEKIDRSRLSR